MNTFHCWNPDDGDEADADAVETVLDAEDAAEMFAERHFNECAGEVGHDFAVHVRDEAGALHVFRILVEYTPSFSATEMPTAPAAAPRSGGYVLPPSAEPAVAVPVEIHADDGEPA